MDGDILKPLLVFDGDILKTFQKYPGSCGCVLKRTAASVISCESCVNDVRRQRFLIKNLSGLVLQISGCADGRHDTDGINGGACSEEGVAAPVW